VCVCVDARWFHTVTALADLHIRSHRDDHDDGSGSVGGGGSGGGSGGGGGGGEFYDYDDRRSPFMMEGEPEEEPVRTLFVSGLPLDVRTREVFNLFRFCPGFETSSISSAGERKLVGHYDSSSSSSLS